jgi:4-amino-4-deoxy-L-arabinose transferase-like glycosyltransferase
LADDSTPSQAFLLSGRAHRAVLAAVVVGAALLRLWALPHVPVGFNQDEAVAAYDAYSVLLMLRDHHGAFLPWHFRAYDDWIPPLHQYLAVPFVAIWGPSATAIRLLSAVVGTATTAGAYALGRALFHRNVGLATALLVAVSPWHVVYGRIGLSVITLPFFLALGAAAFALAAHHPHRDCRVRRATYALSGVFLGLATMTYPVAKLFVPAFVALTLLVYRRSLWAWPGAAFVGGFLVPALPFAASHVVLGGAVQSRFGAVSVFQADHPLLTIATNYARHFWPADLFWNGYRDGVMDMPSGVRQLPLFDAPFVAIGVAALARRWRRPEARWVLGWLLLFPVPGSLTFPEVPHEIRAATGFPVLDLIAALGIVVGLRWLARHAAAHPQWARTGRAAPYFLAAALAVNVGVGLVWYFAIAPREARNMDGKFRRGMDEALAYFRAVPRPDVVWIPQTTGTFFSVLYLVHSGTPPAAQLAADVPRFEHIAPPPAVPPPRSAWVTQETRVPAGSAWQLRRLVLHPNGSVLWAVYTSADLPPGEPLVVQERVDGATPVDAVVLSAVVLAAALVVCRSAAADQFAGLAGRAPELAELNRQGTSPPMRSGDSPSAGG